MAPCFLPRQRQHHCPLVASDGQCWLQDQLPNLQGPVQTGNMGILFKNEGFQDGSIRPLRGEGPRMTAQVTCPRASPGSSCSLPAHCQNLGVSDVQWPEVKGPGTSQLGIRRPQQFLLCSL